MNTIQRRFIPVLWLLALSSVCAAQRSVAKSKAALPYWDSSLSTEERVADLLPRMTLEEKVGQLRCTMAWNYYEIVDKFFASEASKLERTSRQASKLPQKKKSSANNSSTRQLVYASTKAVSPSESFKKDIDEGHIGMLWATYRADPWTQKSLENGLTPSLAAEAGNALQRYVREHTRLGIPLFLAEEAPHGHMAIGATVFPTGLGLAATWSPRLMEQVGRVIAKEIRLQGGHISYGPVLDLARDPRWSRVEETMGEDPVLTAQMGAAMVHGLGGGRLDEPFATLATLKHFIAYGTTEGGQNGAPSVVGERDLLENFLPPFRQAIDAGALSVMTSYNSMDGVPCTANRQLLTDLLRREWQFGGFVVSDLFSIDGIAGTHRVAADRRQAGVMALEAGVDVDLGASSYAQLITAVREGLVSEALIDTAVARVLRLKFAMGLFDHPYVDPKAAREVGSDEHKQLALNAAREAVTLLKNDTTGGATVGAPVLPLSRGKHVLVCGPNADNRYNLLGDYTAPQADGDVVTILDGIRAKVGDAHVDYVKGCAVRDTTDSHIGEAVAAAQRADVIVCCVGGSSARDFRTSYKETGAAEADSHVVSDMDCGEGFDRATLSLLGHQQRLLEALKATGKPLVVVYIEGRPLLKNWAAVNADALLTAYYPGGQGGAAIADVLYGDYNPAGRLPVSVPADVGQLPVYYNKRAPRAHDYVEMAAAPLYPFGYGLSYTTFDYANLRIEAESAQTQSQAIMQTGKASPWQTPLYRVSVDVTNTGNRDGEEVVQLYLHDDLASVVQPLRQLKAFERVAIPKGATRTVTFSLTQDDFALIDRKFQRVVEPGTFTIMVGRSSADICLTGKIAIAE